MRVLPILSVPISLTPMDVRIFAGVRSVPSFRFPRISPRPDHTDARGTSARATIIFYVVTTTAESAFPASPRSEVSKIRRTAPRRRLTRRAQTSKLRGACSCPTAPRPTLRHGAISGTGRPRSIAALIGTNGCRPTANRNGMRMAERGWKRRFDDPVPLPRGRSLVTLEDAGGVGRKTSMWVC